MRKLMVGLIAVALVAVAAPAQAQGPGLSDPLGLIVSGAVLPYLGAGAPGFSNSSSWLEIANSRNTDTTHIADIHMFFFDATCTKGPVSRALRLTPNDVAIFRLDNSDPGNPTTGLVTVAGTENGFALDPTDSEFWARVLWFDVTHGVERVLEPIGAMNEDVFEFLGSSDNNGVNRYNPLNEAVSFFAPLEGGPGFAIHTTILLVCPRKSVLGDTTTNGTKGLATDLGFPFLNMSTGPNQLHGLIFDTDENLLVNMTTSCDCLTSLPLSTLNAIYSDPVLAASGTFTKLGGISIPAKPAVCGSNLIGSKTQDSTAAAPTCGSAVSSFTGTCSGQPDPAGSCTTYNLFNIITPPIAKSPPVPFTGYRDMLLASGPLDLFGRLWNGSDDEVFGPGF